MSAKLFVGSLNYATTDDDLRNIFEQAGQVESAKVIFDRETRRSKGFGFVEMATEEEAQKAIQMFDGHEVEGRRLVVNIARPMPERSERSDRGNFNRSQRY